MTIPVQFGRPRFGALLITQTAGKDHVITLTNNKIQPNDEKTLYYITRQDSYLPLGNNDEVGIATENLNHGNYPGKQALRKLASDTFVLLKHNLRDDEADKPAIEASVAQNRFHKFHGRPDNVGSLVNLSPG